MQLYPLFQTKKVVDSLPETPGFYYFKNEAKEIIHDGKGNNINQRINSLFYDKRKKAQDMNLKTDNIYFTKTGSKL